MGKILATRSRNGDLYSLDLTNQPASALFAIFQEAYEDTWSAWLGHPQTKMLWFLHNSILVDINVWLKRPSVCQSCQL